MERTPATEQLAFWESPDEWESAHVKKIRLPAKLTDLRQKLYQKAKLEPKFRFYVLYDRIFRRDVLSSAYQIARANKGKAGVDGVTFDDIETSAGGVEGFLDEIQESLKAKTYRPMAVRRTWIPKPDGRKRPLGIPTIRDRVVQTAVLLVLEPIFEADFMDCSYGFRPGRSAHDALDEVRGHLKGGLNAVYDADLKGYLETSSYYTSFHERFSKRVGWVLNTLILKPFLFPDRRWTAESSPRFTRCKTVCLDTPRNLVASCMGT